MVPQFFLLYFLVTGIFLGWRYGKKNAIWWSGCGTVLIVLTLLLSAGLNNTCYYYSLSDLQSSLNIVNSSSSEYTLKVMSVVSLFIPVVVAYIWYSWRSLSRKKIDRREYDTIINP